MTILIFIAIVVKQCFNYFLKNQSLAELAILPHPLPFSLKEEKQKKRQLKGNKERILSLFEATCSFPFSILIEEPTSQYFGEFKVQNAKKIRLRCNV